MKRLLITIVLFLSVAANGVDIRTLDGKIYINARITRTDAIGVNILHSKGACYVPFTNLAESVRTAYHYDPVAASALEEARNAALLKSRLDEQRQRDAKSIKPASKQAVPIVKNAKPSTEYIAPTTKQKPVSESRDYTVVDYSSRNYNSGRNYSSDRVYVRGYYRKNGTYVRPHTRSK